MVAHRKNVPAPRAYVPSTWFIVLSVMLVVGAGGWLGWLVVGDGSSPSEAAAPTAASTKPPVTTPVTPVTPVPSATSSTPAPDASSEPAPDETSDSPDEPEPTTQRSAPVSVLNNSGVVGAARTFSAKVGGAGWTLAGIGNWTGSIPANTVYYPPGLQSQAERLAKDVGIGRVRPSVSPMRSDRLTIILSGAQ
jgi:cytoskeletal protein RodZ